MQPSAILLVSTIALALVGLAPRQAEAVPVHGGVGVGFYGPYVGFGIGFPYYPRFSFSYYPYYYPTYAPYAAHPSWQGYYPGSGAVRMMIDAKDAEVFVDGYYAGTVDDFDGTFQKLYLQPGEHLIELRLDGHRTFTQRILISPGHTQKLHHRMEPGGPESEPPEPRRPESRRSPQSEGGSPEGAGGGPAAPIEGVSSGEFGVLRLRVQPAEGEILIDAESWGELGGLEEISIHIPAGMHRIELRRGGTPVFEAEFQIRQAETTPLNIRLP